MTFKHLHKKREDNAGEGESQEQNAPAEEVTAASKEPAVVYIETEGRDHVQCYAFNFFNTIYKTNIGVILRPCCRSTETSASSAMPCCNAKASSMICRALWTST